MKFHPLTVLGTIAATAALGASPAAVAAGGPPPINDNYLSSLNLNQPGTPLNRASTLSDVRDTSSATVQADVFSPPQSGGPAEVTGCGGVSEAKTIWYDFYPDANGLVRIRSSAQFGAIMAVMPFDAKTLIPDIAGRKCAVNQIAKAAELFDEVKAGQAYTVQIGGVNEAGGPVEFLFDYLVKLKRVQAEATLTAQPLTAGVRIVNLSVTAPRKARVLVRCTRACGSHAKTARTLSFSNLRGTVLTSGSAVKIYVTAKNQIGAYIEYKIRRGSFVKTTRCLAAGSLKPTRCE